jgi:hypothetical protein
MTDTTSTAKNNGGIVGVSVSDDDDLMMMVSVIPNSSDQDEENVKITTHDNQNQKQNPRTTRTHQKYKLVSSLVLLAFGSVILSVLTIYSCNFFSYRDITSTTDGFTEALNSNNNNYNLNNNFEENNNLSEYMYSPFEYLNEAGVGLFAYYMGNPSSISSSSVKEGIGGTSSSKFYKQDPMCFLYCDELNDFQWFFKNYNHYNTNDNVEDDVKDESSPSRRIDLWILARYCSIFAPCIAILGIIQLLIIVFNYYCCGGCGVNNKFATKCLSKFLLFITFVIASAFQFGTFTIMFASPQLSSFNMNGNVMQEQFCSFSSIESTNGIKCRFDSGAWLSLGAGIGYLLIALLLLISILFCKTSTSIITTTGNSDSDSNNKTNTNTDDSSFSSEEQDF